MGTLLARRISCSVNGNTNRIHMLAEQNGRTTFESVHPLAFRVSWTLLDVNFRRLCASDFQSLRIWVFNALRKVVILFHLFRVERELSLSAEGAQCNSLGQRPR